MRAKKLAGLTALGLALALTGATTSVAAAVAGPDANDAPMVAARGGRAIAGQYIVVLKSGRDARSVAASAFAAPRHVYDAALNGFSASLTAGQVTLLRRNRDVEYIEEDAEIHLDATENMDANGDPWGIDRIDQRNLPLSRTYTSATQGAGVRAYIIDTGIQTSHPEFGGRASAVFDALGGNGQDCNGHGTHVAGTVGGTTYGVAKQALLRAVRVLDCNGSGATSGVIAGMNWVRQNSIHPAVANMSLGGGLSQAVNTAATNLVNSGVFLAVAAGNSNANACNSSPASATGVFTVAASDKTDLRASFSNFGSCVEAYAPGVAIKSAWLNGTTNTISGTSMATPHVTGVGALYKSSRGDASASTISSFLLTNATMNAIRSNPSGTPNRLLFEAF
jgi:subtilisin family serine protease